MSAFTIAGEQLACASPVASLYTFLSDFSNFKGILPEDKVEDFSYDENSCAFTIKGITAIRIRLADKRTNEFLCFQSEGLAKFNFKLEVYFEAKENSNGECRMLMRGDMNPFIFKMAEKPLQQLVNSMSQKLSQLQNTNA